MTQSQVLLRIPPFPGARSVEFAVEGGDETRESEGLLAALARHRVGGTYWGIQPPLPAGPLILDGTKDPIAGALSWPALADPWHYLDNAEAAHLNEGDPRILLALAAGVQVRVVSANGAERPVEAEPLVSAYLTRWRWHDPFDGSTISALQAIELCGFWRQLIDSNREVKASLGFAHWKRPTVAPLLWNGHTSPFSRGAPRLQANDQVAIWRSRLSPAQAQAIENCQLLEVEDGFVRSIGLGADCVPPLSIIVDRQGVHFDPNKPSELENYLQSGNFPAPLVARAARLRTAIVDAGLSKYAREAEQTLPRPAGRRRHVLVPGQVEDDRSVTSGGALTSNLELLRRARAEAGSDAYLIYKPHPDVMAGHRRGSIAEQDLTGLADQVETSAPMPALIDMVDELHVNTSLAGFEALLRGKPVAVHGVPFYAGWGLTSDRGPIPARRTSRRTLDELVAATLLLYPRYLDPQTGLPCPAEVLVQRLAADNGQRLDHKASLIVKVRRSLGRLREFAGR